MATADQPRSSALKDSDQGFKAARKASEQTDGKIASSVKSEADPRLYQRSESLKEKKGSGYEEMFERESPQKKHESPRRSSVSSDVSDDREKTKRRGSFEKKDLFAAAATAAGNDYVPDGIAAPSSTDKLSIDPIRASVTRNETLTTDQLMMEKISPIPLWMKSHMSMPSSAAVSSSVNAGHSELAFGNVMASMVSERPTDALMVSSQGSDVVMKQGQVTQGAVSTESGIVVGEIERSGIHEGADVGGR